MILIVDDNADIRRVIALLFQMEGFETTEAASGADAFRRMDDELPHCLILDYNMPEMDGLEVLRLIRSTPRWASVRVILFSAWGVELRERAMAAGANAFVEKTSLDFAELRRQVIAHCRPARPAELIRASDSGTTRRLG